MLSFIEPTLFDKLRGEHALPSPNGVRLTIMRMCSEENPNMKELAHLVQSDPSLSGRIIRIVNLTNAHRMRPVAAASIDVLLLVGLQSIRQLALALSLSEGKQTPACANFHVSAFWRRSFAMAAAAQTITEFTNVAPLTEMFTTGLLAGIGKLALACVRPTSYSALLEHKISVPAQLAMEQSLFGFHHLSLAAALMQDWKIPLLFCDAVLHHELPTLSGKEAGSRQQEIIWTLSLASHIADLGIGDIETALQTPQSIETALEQLTLSWNDFAHLYGKTADSWQEWAREMHFGGSTVWRDMPQNLPASATSKDTSAGDREEVQCKS